eukprot:m.481613 g.481613  ORF g.481613 m.481613 type:complete len:184 (-) comp22250_c0_seq1:53-604(-)
MIKLFSLKQQQKEGDGAAAEGGGAKKTSPAVLRVTKDHNELSLPESCQIDFDNPDDLLNFHLTICPTEGMYAGGRFHFTFQVNDSYPHEPPKVHCNTKIYHPNIDLDGNICLNVLREDWKPVLNLQTIIYGLVFLFLEPNSDDPLNKEAATVMKESRSTFERNVRKAMRGGSIGGVHFDHCVA